MRIRSIGPLTIAVFSTAVAAPSSDVPADKPASETAARDAALDNLLSERESIKALETAVDNARKAGVSEQAILEARFLYHVDRREDEAIAAMLPEFLKRKDEFKQGDSAVFAVKEDWLAVIEYVQAIAALEKGDKGAFKQHITEAFWLSPRQAAAFAPHIERMRLDESMRSVKIDFSLKLAPLAGGEPVALSKLIEGKKALLFHFWSPASRECEAAMPDFAATAGELSADDLAVVSLLPDDTPKLIADASAMIRPIVGKPCGAWLVDSKEKPLGRDLRVQTLPAMVLVSTEGKVLFNGDPTDDEFWQALNKIDARITRPEAKRDEAK